MQKSFIKNPDFPMQHNASTPHAVSAVVSLNKKTNPTKKKTIGCNSAFVIAVV